MLTVEPASDELIEVQRKFALESNNTQPVLLALIARIDLMKQESKAKDVEIARLNVVIGSLNDDLSQMSNSNTTVARNDY